MRYVRIIFTALLMYTLLVGVAMAEEVSVVDDVGHTWISSDLVFVDEVDKAVLGKEYHYAIPLQVQTGSGADGVVDVPEDDEARGEEFVFSLVNNTSLPDGLTMDKAGIISGTPAKGGIVTLWVQVDDADGNLRARRNIRLVVTYKTVTLDVEAPNMEWTSAGATNGYKATFAIREEQAVADGVALDDFSVTYRNIKDGTTVKGDLLTTVVRDCGTYEVRLTANSSLQSKSYVMQSGGLTTLVVRQNEHASMVLANKQVIRGDAYSMLPVTTPADLAYKMVFEGIDGTEYGPTEVPPESTQVGKYRVTATTTASEYKQIVTTATLEIRQLEVEFEIKDAVDGDHIYWPHSATYLEVNPVGDLPEGVTYTVLYNGKPVNTTKGEYYPQDAGDYEVTIELNNPRYVAKYTPTTLTIGKSTMRFSISVFEKKIIYTGEQYRPKFTKEGIDNYNDSFTIDDLGTPDVVETYRYVTEKGKYQANVELNEEHARNYVADTSEAIFEIVDPPTLEMNDANSPAAKGATKDADGNYVYDGVTYPAAVWGDGTNYDADKKVWFTRKGNIDPYRYGVGLGTVYGEDVFVNPMPANQGWIDWSANADVGIYDVEYSTVQYYFNGNLTSVKTNGVIVVLPEEAVGDANRDGYVNVGDARYLQNVVIPNISNMTSDADRLYLYRVCDVNHDGKVDADDVAAILNRKNVPLVGYYDYLDDETNRNPEDVDKD